MKKGQVFGGVAAGFALLAASFGVAAIPSAASGSPLLVLTSSTTDTGP